MAAEVPANALNNTMWLHTLFASVHPDTVGLGGDERRQPRRHGQRPAHADEQLAPAEVTPDACRRPRVQIHLVCFGALREETETNKGLKARRRIR